MKGRRVLLRYRHGRRLKCRARRAKALLPQCHASHEIMSFPEHAIAAMPFTQPQSFYHKMSCPVPTKPLQHGEENMSSPPSKKNHAAFPSYAAACLAGVHAARVM